jgi:hypothetical protein
MVLVVVRRVVCGGRLIFGHEVKQLLLVRKEGERVFL